MAIAKKDSTTKNITSSPSLHPPYLQMITEAITTMKDRSGSSQPAIAKFIEENCSKQLPPNFRKILSVQLKKFVKSEKLVKVKNSYKISTTEKVKKSPNPAPKNPPAKKETAKKSTHTESAEKSKKTKRLSQVKTPEALKKKTAAKTTSSAGQKVKKGKALTPAKRKVGPKSGKTGSSPPAKKAKKN